MLLIKCLWLMHIKCKELIKILRIFYYTLNTWYRLHYISHSSNLNTSITTSILQQLINNIKL